MNKTRIVLSYVILITALASKIQANEGRITFIVVDEVGLSISGAEVKGQFNNAMAPGTGWGTGKPTEVNEITDKNGICVLTGDGNEPSAGAGIFKDGYYGNGGGVEFTNSYFGRWQPWNPTVKVVLQKIGVQVPVYAKRVWQARIPREGQPVGFDLMVGDWVAPDGKGQMADMLFTFTKKTNGAVQVPHYPGEHQLIDNTLTIAFLGDGDGIQSAVRNSGGLRLRREALTNGYSPSLIKHEVEAATNIVSGNITEIRITRHSDFSNSANYFFRVRSKTDNEGNITNALYGKIYGDFNVDFNQGRIGFTYYLNPKPNSRNMEFNTQQNLFTNLPPFERVSAP